MEGAMRITWLGHASFRIEIAGQTLLVDPWLRGNPAFDEARFDAAADGATAVLVTHAHGDHVGSAVEVATAQGAPIYGIYDLVGQLTAGTDAEAVGFNKGGTVAIGDVAVTMVNAVHSSSLPSGDGPPAAAGSEAGFMIAGEGRTIYFAGDTDVHADMALYQELHAPHIGILPIGGHFTMDAFRAAFACRKFFNFELVIPSHYATFPLLAQSADDFAAQVAPTPVRAPKVMEAVEI
jgi:L-ascorbate metabolism protein UlaG (beta-lactamase superfamily)